MSAAPLVLVTRPAGAEDPLVARLAAAGCHVAAVPTVVTRPAAAGGPLDEALADPHGWDWIVVTSAAGAQATADAMARVRTALATGTPADAPARAAALSRPRWAAVGPATAQALRASGIVPALVPADASGLGVAAALTAADAAHGRRILLARADAASDDLPLALRAAGADVRDVVAYHTVEAPAASAGPIADALRDEALAIVVAASGSALRGLLRLASDHDLAARVRRTPLVTIGPSTTAVAHDLGFATVIQAARPSSDALADTVLAELLAATPVTTSRRNP